MEKQSQFSFIAIDDDEVFNIISSHIIRENFPRAEIHTFLEPEKGLDFIQNTIDAASHVQILLLDINMPTLSGWDVLEKLKEMGSEVCSKLNIFILLTIFNYKKI